MRPILHHVDHELTLRQVREIARIRRRHPGADVYVHRRSWGLIVEARRRGRTVELERFGWDGSLAPEHHLGLAAAA